MRSSWAYAAAVATFCAIIVLMLRAGAEIVAPGSTASSIPSPGSSSAFSILTELWKHHASSPFPRLLFQFLVIVAMARAGNAIARRVGQPAVLGEIAAGIALGPSILGALAPPFSAHLFPESSLPALQLFSQLGVILFMFVVGLELDWTLVRSRARVAVAVSHVSILLPFLLGVTAAIPLYARYAPAETPFHAFALFMGIALSITAFPVLARILEDRGISKTAIGSTAITCAAIDDVTAWTILAFVVAVVTAGDAFAILVVTLALATAFVGVMAYAVRPLLARALVASSDGERLGSDRLSLVLLVLFVAAAATEVLGVHGLFGAFVAGAVMPADPELRADLRERLESVASVFLLPVFFVLTGLRTEIGLLGNWSAWLTCAALIGLATVGKLGGSMVTARALGMDWRSSFVLGALMNTRGLMELVALNVGYDLGVISPEMFTILVIMALVTTALTGPLLDLELAHSSPVALDRPRRTR